MKKRRVLFFILLALLFVGIPTSLLLREYRREQANKELIAAIKADNTRRAIAALRAGADPNCRDHSNAPPLSFSAHLKQLFERLLHPQAHSKRDTDPTALDLVFFQTRIPSDVDLQAFQRHPTSQQISQLYPLVRVPEEHPQLVKALLDAGADPNLKVEEGWTPLHRAALNGYDESVRLLIQHGADVHTGPVLEMAGIQGHVSTVRILMDSGANVNFRSGNGRTTLDVVMDPIGIADPEIIAMLKKAGAKTGRELDAEKQR